MLTCPSRSIGAQATHCAVSGSTSSNCTTDRALASTSKSGCSQPRYTRQWCTAASREARARATTTRCAEPTTASRLAASVWRNNNRADHLISYLNKLMKIGSEIIEATLRRRWILFAGLVARMEDTRLPKCVMFGELLGGAGCVEGQEKECMDMFPGRPQSFRHHRRPVDNCRPG